jgi:hypothetical protein
MTLTPSTQNLTASINLARDPERAPFEGLVAIIGNESNAILFLVALCLGTVACITTIWCIFFRRKSKSETENRPPLVRDERKLSLFSLRSLSSEEEEFPDPAPLDPYDRINWDPKPIEERATVSDLLM